MKKTYNKLQIKLTLRDNQDVITASVPNAKDDNETTPMPFPAFSPIVFG